MRTYGSATLEGGVWTITAEPHVAIEFKRVFPRVDAKEVGRMKLADTPEICRRLKWFSDLYPIEFNGTAQHLERSAAQYIQHVQTMDELLRGTREPKQFKLALPPRKYQSQAAELYLRQGYLLLGDDVGLGKTVTTIATFTDQRVLPAVVVCHPFLQNQWMREVNKFAPALTVHIIKTIKPYALDLFMGRLPDVIIITYAKLANWAQILGRLAKSVAFDEGQELRHNNSEKYGCAKHLSERLPFRLLMSATPIHNYGGEMFNVLSIAKPGCLGAEDEFHREWCTNVGDNKWKINDPKAFGAYLRDNHLMLRRTRAEVQRELPPIIKIPQQIDIDHHVIREAEDQAAELARIILSKTESYRGERLEASGRLDSLIRHRTGVAKAPHVVEFVRMLVESGERVLLAGWHRAVYEIWQKRFEQAKIRSAMFTGSESPAQKERARELFVRGDIDVLIMSLRSGAGIDGLQGCCKVVVFGELDWSPAVHLQFAGRVHRDGQKEPVTAYFLVSESGADPLMLEVLGIKANQINGITEPRRNIIERLETSGDHVRKLAMKYLSRHGLARPIAPPQGPPTPLPAPERPKRAPVQSKWKISFARPVAR